MSGAIRDLLEELHNVFWQMDLYQSLCNVVVNGLKSVFLKLDHETGDDHKERDLRRITLSQTAMTVCSWLTADGEMSVADFDERFDTINSILLDQVKCCTSDESTMPFLEILAHFGYKLPDAKKNKLLKLLMKQFGLHPPASVRELVRRLRVKSNATASKYLPNIPVVTAKGKTVLLKQPTKNRAGKSHYKPLELVTNKRPHPTPPLSTQPRQHSHADSATQSHTGSSPKYLIEDSDSDSNRLSASSLCRRKVKKRLFHHPATSGLVVTTKTPRSSGKDINNEAKCDKNFGTQISNTIALGLNVVEKPLIRKPRLYGNEMETVKDVKPLSFKELQTVNKKPLKTKESREKIYQPVTSQKLSPSSVIVSSVGETRMSSSVGQASVMASDVEDVQMDHDEKLDWCGNKMDCEDDISRKLTDIEESFHGIESQPVCEVSSISSHMSLLKVRDSIHIPDSFKIASGFTANANAMILDTQDDDNSDGAEPCSEDESERDLPVGNLAARKNTEVLNHDNESLDGIEPEAINYLTAIANCTELTSCDGCGSQEELSLANLVSKKPTEVLSCLPEVEFSGKMSNWPNSKRSLTTTDTVMLSSGDETTSGDNAPLSSLAIIKPMDVISLATEHPAKRSIFCGAENVLAAKLVELSTEDETESENEVARYLAFKKLTKVTSNTKELSGKGYHFHGAKKGFAANDFDISSEDETECEYKPRLGCLAAKMSIPSSAITILSGTDQREATVLPSKNNTFSKSDSDDESDCDIVSCTPFTESSIQKYHTKSFPANEAALRTGGKMTTGNANDGFESDVHSGTANFMPTPTSNTTTNLVGKCLYEKRDSEMQPPSSRYFNQHPSSGSSNVGKEISRDAPVNLPPSYYDIQPEISSEVDDDGHSSLQTSNCPKSLRAIYRQAGHVEDENSGVKGTVSFKQSSVNSSQLPDKNRCYISTPSQDSFAEPSWRVTPHASHTDDGGKESDEDIIPPSQSTSFKMPVDECYKYANEMFSRLYVCSNFQIESHLEISANEVNADGKTGSFSQSSENSAQMPDMNRCFISAPSQNSFIEASRKAPYHELETGDGNGGSDEDIIPCSQIYVSSYFQKINSEKARVRILCDQESLIPENESDCEDLAVNAITYLAKQEKAILNDTDSSPPASLANEIDGYGSEVDANEGLDGVLSMVTMAESSPVRSSLQSFVDLLTVAANLKKQDVITSCNYNESPTPSLINAIDGTEAEGFDDSDDFGGTSTMVGSVAVGSPSELLEDFLPVISHRKRLEKITNSCDGSPPQSLINATMGLRRKVSDDVSDDMERSSSTGIVTESSIVGSPTESLVHCLTVDNNQMGHEDVMNSNNGNYSPTTSLCNDINGSERDVSDDSNDSEKASSTVTLADFNSSMTCSFPFQLL